MSKIKLIVGLGNPGAQYEGTRHNAGEWLVLQIARQYNISMIPDKKYFGLTGTGNIAGQPVRLLIPTTFMNLSGKAVGALANFFRIAPDEILVAHDELDMPPGVAKFKLGGGHGGHNGLKDIIKALANSKDFYRLRIGIGHPGHRDLVSGYVLNKPPIANLNLIHAAIDEASIAIEILMKDGINKASNRLNAFKA